MPYGSNKYQYFYRLYQGRIGIPRCSSTLRASGMTRKYYEAIRWGRSKRNICLNSLLANQLVGFLSAVRYLLFPSCLPP